MSIHIVKVVNASKPEEEYVELKVDDKTVNLAGFAIVDNTFDSDEKKSNIFRHIFTFPNIEVKEGDYLRVYSGKGEKEDFSNKAKTRTYKFFWDAGKCVWNDTKDEAILIQYTVANRFNVPKKDEKK